MDGAFEKALRAVRKRRKVGEAGGDVRGGFGVEDEEMGGGFVADEEDGGGGGFMPDDEPTPSTTSPHPSDTADLLPYSALPDVFTTLGLTWDDDVLATFKAIQAASRGHQEGADQSSWSMDDNYVDLKDFRSVVGVLMEPEEDRDGEEDDDDDDDDAYAEDDAMHGDSSDLSEPADDASPTIKSRRKPGGGGRTKTAQSTEEDAALRIQQTGQRNLTREEKDWVANMWETMFEGTTIGPGQRGEHGRLLGKEQIKRWADQLGMTWTDQEVSRAGGGGTRGPRGVLMPKGMTAHGNDRAVFHAAGEARTRV